MPAVFGWSLDSTSNSFDTVLFALLSLITQFNDPNMECRRFKCVGLSGKCLCRLEVCGLPNIIPVHGHRSKNSIRRDFERSDCRSWNLSINLTMNSRHLVFARLSFTSGNDSWTTCPTRMWFVRINHTFNSNTDNDSLILIRYWSLVVAHLVYFMHDSQLRSVTPSSSDFCASRETNLVALEHIRLSHRSLLAPDSI